MSKLRDVLEIMDSLTKSEKRYITLIIKEKTSHEAYLELFQKLMPYANEKTEIREKEETLKRKKEKEKLHNLFSTQNLTRLHQFLLSSLRQYNADKPPYSIEEQIQHIRILHHKQCYEQALKLIKKTRKEVESRYEDDIKGLELTMLERRIMRNRTGADPKHIKRLEKLSEKHYKGLKETLDVYGDDERLHQHYPHDGGRHKTALSETLQKLLRNLDEVDQLSFQAAVLGLASLSDYYSYQEENPEKAIEAAYRLVRLYERNTWRMTYHMENYLNALVKYFNKLYLQNRTSDFGPTLERIKSVLNRGEAGPPLGPNQLDFSPRSAIYYNLLNLIVIYYNHHTGDPAAKGSIADVHQALQRKPDIKDNLLLTIYFNMATFYLLAGQLDLANQYVLEILNYSGKTVHGIRFRTEILSLVLDFETIRAHEDREKLEARIGVILGKIRDQSQEEIKNLARNFITRLALILFQTDPHQQLPLLKMMLQAMPEKESARFGFANFRLWIEKKLAEIR